MEREIEFRGKTYSDKWVYGYLLKGSIDNDFYILENLGGTPFCIALETVGQYVGIADKNGKKIFEHDIVKTKYGRLCRVVRVSLPSYVGWDLEVFDENNALTTKKPDEYDLYYKDNLEVIGTVFDKESDNGD